MTMAWWMLDDTTKELSYKSFASNMASMTSYHLDQATGASELHCAAKSKIFQTTQTQIVP